MQRLKSLQSLEGNPPNDALLNHLLIHLMPVDHLEDIPALKTLRNDAEAIGQLIEEGIFVRKDEGILDTGEDAHLIQTICQLFFGKGRDTHLLQGVLLTVLLSLDSVDCREGAFAKLRHHRVLIH